MQNKVLLVIAFAVVVLFSNVSSFAVDINNSAQANVTPDNVVNNKSVNSEARFEYQIVRKSSAEEFFKIKNSHFITRNIVKIQFIKSGGVCQYVCSLTKKGDTLDIGCTCVPGSQMKHLGYFCFFCKISNLEKGVYYLNYYGSNGYKQILIK